jgi:hypothetical protein
VQQELKLLSPVRSSWLHRLAAGGLEKKDQDSRDRLTEARFGAVLLGGSDQEEIHTP